MCDRYKEWLLIFNTEHRNDCKVSRKVRQKQTPATFVTDNESVHERNKERDRNGGGLMISLPLQKRDWLHGRQGDSDRPLRKCLPSIPCASALDKCTIPSR